MLPEVSSNITAANGVLSAPKDEIFCSMPSSKIENCFSLSPATALPLLSVIAAFTTTTEESTLITSSPCPRQNNDPAISRTSEHSRCELDLAMQVFDESHDRVRTVDRIGRDRETRGLS